MNEGKEPYRPPGCDRIGAPDRTRGLHAGLPKVESQLERSVALKLQLNGGEQTGQIYL